VHARERKRGERHCMQRRAPLFKVFKNIITHKSKVQIKFRSYH
jgi:hypothetical protein